MSRIPGTLTEVRYRRVGRDAGLYKHKFTGPVRMLALSDGSVLLKGRGRIHADEDRTPGFSRYYHRKRSQPMRRQSYRRNPSPSHGGGGSLMPLALIAGAVWLLSSRPGGLSTMFAPRAPATYATNPDAVMTQAQASLVKTGIQGGTSLVNQAIANWFKLIRSGQTPAGVPADAVTGLPVSYADQVAQANAAPIVPLGGDYSLQAPTLDASAYVLNAGEAATQVDSELAAAFTI